MIQNIFQNYQSGYWRNGFDDIGSFILTLVVITSIICLIPNFLYWYQLPYIRDWLRRHKNIKEIIALVICGTFVAAAVAYIVQIPSCIHFRFWGFEFDSGIVFPCFASVVLAAGSVLYCRRLPIVKNWLAKQKNRREK